MLDCKLIPNLTFLLCSLTLHYGRKGPQTKSPNYRGQSLVHEVAPSGTKGALLRAEGVLLSNQSTLVTYQGLRES